jgi:hypothetical protein
MTPYREIIEVDLTSVGSKQELLHLLGEIFELGGPGGNVPVTGPTEGKGWGCNWDALADSLSCLSEGGIWGTSRVFQFPLFVTFKGSATYRASDPEGYTTFVEILEGTRSLYASEDLQFDYTGL